MYANVCTCVVEIGPGVGVATAGGGVAGCATDICVAVKPVAVVPSAVTVTFEPTVNVAPKTTVEDDIATGVVVPPVLSLKPYEVDAATVPVNVELANGDEESETVLAVTEEQRVPVPVKTPYWPTAGVPSKYTVDALSGMYMEPQPLPALIVNFVLLTPTICPACISTPDGTGIGEGMGVGDGDGDGVGAGVAVS
jgi:hypothetical protein